MDDRLGIYVAYGESDIIKDCKYCRKANKKSIAIGGAAWIGVAHDGTWLALLQDTDSIREVLRYIEVIGNTHDNPEI